MPSLTRGVYPVPVCFLDVAFSLANLDLHQHDLGQLKGQSPPTHSTLSTVPFPCLPLPMATVVREAGARLCYFRIQRWAATIFDDNCISFTSKPINQEFVQVRSPEIRAGDLNVELSDLNCRFQTCPGGAASPKSYDLQQNCGESLWVSKRFSCPLGLGP